MKENIYLSQANYSQVFNGSINYWLPYSIACLQAYAQSKEHVVDAFDFKELLFKREPLQDIIDRLDNPAVFGYSLYVWNTEYEMQLAKLVKKHWPNCINVFGGPNSKVEHAELEYCDVVVRNEGEIAFTSILEHIIKKEPIPPVISAKRIDDLEVLPSPFTQGLFDDIVAANPDVLWLASFESDRGCPYSCTFCDWGSLTASKVRKFSMEKVTEEIRWLAHNKVVYVFPANANFGILKDRDIYIATLLAEAEDSMFEGVNFQYLKNNTEVALIIESILGTRLSRGLTLSKQSENVDTLAAIKRKNLNNEKFEKMTNLASEYGVITYSELILPLPLETLETFKEGITNLIEQGQHSAIDVWPSMILPNSEMGQPEDIEKYGLEIVKAVDYNSWSNEDVNIKGYVPDYNDESVHEKTELVVGTNTMSKREVCDAYVYSWLITNMHSRGYTQVVSRYLNGRHGVPFRQFYDRLLEKCYIDRQLSNIVNLFRERQEYYLANGYYPTDKKYDHLITETNNAHFFATVAREELVKIKNHVIDLAISVANEFVVIPDEVEEIQRYALFDNNHDYPKIVKLDYDLFSKEEKDTTYTIGPRSEKGEDINKNHVWKNRRVGSKNVVSTESNGEQSVGSLLATDRVVIATAKATEKYEKKSL